MACKYLDICNHQSAWCKLDTVAIKCEYRPVADVQPVFHAKWTVLAKRKAIFLDNADEQYKALGFPHRNILQMRCSNCGVLTQVDDSIAYEYCPHCGAKMDGD